MSAFGLLARYVMALQGVDFDWISVFPAQTSQAVTCRSLRKHWTHCSFWRAAQIIEAFGALSLPVTYASTSKTFTPRYRSNDLRRVFSRATQRGRKLHLFSCLYTFILKISGGFLEPCYVFSAFVLSLSSCFVGILSRKRVSDIVNNVNRCSSKAYDADHDHNLRSRRSRITTCSHFS